MDPFFASKERSEFELEAIAIARQIIVRNQSALYLKNNFKIHQNSTICLSIIAICVNSLIELNFNFWIILAQNMRCAFPSAKFFD